MARRLNKKTVKETRQCNHCYEEVEIDNYFKINSSIYDYSPICKECAKKIFNDEYDKTKNINSSALKLCSLLDIPFDKEKFGEVCYRMESKTEEVPIFKVFSEYSRVTNVAEKLKGKSFEATEIYFADTVIEKKITEEDSSALWGIGVKNEEKARLNELYESYSKTIDSDDYVIVNLVADLCRVCYKIESGSSDKNLLAEKIKIIDTLGMSPEKLMKEKKDRQGQETWGSKIAYIEKTRPAEHLDKEVYKDIDGFSNYFLTHFIRPIKNLLKGDRNFPEIVFDEEGDVEIIEDYVEPEKELERMDKLDEELAQKEVVYNEENLSEEEV